MTVASVQPIKGTVLNSAILCFLMMLVGCAHSEEPQLEAEVPVKQQTAPMDDLIRLEATADSRGQITGLIRSYAAISADSSLSAAAKTRIASLYLLLGAQYSDSKSEKRRLYASAKNATEEAMLQHKRFSAARNKGQSIPESAVDLPVDAYESLFLWSTAIFYHFRDVASVPERILFNKRLKQAAAAIEVMLSRQPEWYGGSLQFSLGIYYLSVPEAIGGDRERATMLMNQAVAMSDKRLLTRWGRAKYLAVAQGDRKLFLEDLNWVVAQDLSEMEGPPVWNRYFQQDASAMLADMDAYF